MSILEDRQVRTALQISGFESESSSIQSICLQALQQPSWVSSVVLSKKSNSQVTLSVASTLGIIFFLVKETGGWNCRERTACCMADYTMGGEHTLCATCHQPVRDRTDFPTVLFPQKDDDDRVKQEGSIEQFKSKSVSVFETLGADYFEALLLSQELMGLIESIYYHLG